MKATPASVWLRTREIVMSKGGVATASDVQREVCIKRNDLLYCAKTVPSE